MTKIFISYARKDGNEMAEHLLERLTGCGFDVWKDSEGIAVGDNFPGAISRALDEADEFIILVSPAALRSDWVDSEINMAMAKQCRILPVVLQGVANKDIPLMVRTRNYVTIKDSNDWEALHKLVNSVKGGKKIPRVYSMSKQTDTPYQNVLLLKRSALALEAPKNSREVVKVAKAMWRDFLLLSKKIPNLGLVPPGYAPLACAVTSLLAGKPNQLPRLYYPEAGKDNKFRVGANVFIELQKLRQDAQTQRK